MASDYYKPCEELERCEALGKYWEDQAYEEFFNGYLKIAVETGYALAECQVGFCYLEGYGTAKDLEKAYLWCMLSAIHGDWDAQYNLASMYEAGLYVNEDMEKAKYWYQCSADQGHKLAIQKCKEFQIEYK